MVEAAGRQEEAEEGCGSETEGSGHAHAGRSQGGSMSTPADDTESQPQNGTRSARKKPRL